MDEIKNLSKIEKFTVLHFSPTFQVNVETLSDEDKKWIENMLQEWTHKMRDFEKMINEKIK